MKDLYIIREIGTNLYKIGVSNNPEERLFGLQSANAHKLEIVVTITEGEEYEHILHQIFREYNIRGEWFSISTLTLFSILIGYIGKEFNIKPGISLMSEWNEEDFDDKEIHNI